MDNENINISNNSNISNNLIIQLPEEYGFVIIRHVSIDRHNTLWQDNYNNIRKYYPLSIKIMIVDDNSSTDTLYNTSQSPNFYSSQLTLKDIDKYYIKNDPNLSIYYIADYEPELLSCGEILGYYMFNKIKPFKYAIVIHDSAIMNKYIDFQQYIKNMNNIECFPLWDFEHTWDNFYYISQIISLLDNNIELINTCKNLSKWYGFFGIMSIVSNNYLDDINNRYGILNPEKIKILKGSREMRMGMERIWGIIYFTEHIKNNTLKYNNYVEHKAIFGNIHEYYVNNGYKHWYDNYEDYKNKKFNKLPIVKIWNDR